MDYVNRDWCRTLFHSLQGRIRFVSNSFTQRLRLARPTESLSRKLKATLLLVLALTLGIAAHRLNNNEVELLWRKTHLPSAKIWASSFASEGFRPVRNPTWIAKITRTLPTLSDSAGKIWKADPDWWVVETADMTAPLVYCLGCDPKTVPRTWSLAGSSWDGWEETMAESHQQAVDAAKRRQRPRISAEKIDPREIRY
jgi:hypothetical protein